MFEMSHTGILINFDYVSKIKFIEEPCNLDPQKICYVIRVFFPDGTYEDFARYDDKSHVLKIFDKLTMQLLRSYHWHD